MGRLLVGGEGGGDRLLVGQDSRGILAVSCHWVLVGQQEQGILIVICPCLLS